MPSYRWLAGIAAVAQVTIGLVTGWQILIWMAAATVLGGVAFEIWRSFRSDAFRATSTQPAETTVIDRPTDVDLLGFRQFADPLAARIAALQHSDTPWTIGLYGEWGSGKTSFLLMVDRALRRKGIQPVWFNAWRYTREDDLWSALLQTVLSHIRVAGPFWRRPVVAFQLWLRTIDYRAGSWLIARKVMSLSLRLALVIVAGVFVIGAVAGAASPFSAALSRIFASYPPVAHAFTSPWLQAIIGVLALLVAGPDQLIKIFGNSASLDLSKLRKRRHYPDRIAFIDEFSTDLREILRIASRGKPQVIIIDDLDRCLPEQALQVVDGVKMFLDVPGCVFLLAIDREIIEDAVSQKYSHVAHPQRLRQIQETYVERIVQLPLPLPPPRPQSIVEFVELMLPADAEVQRCRPILVGPAPYNPRRVKRHIQTFLVYRDFAAADASAPPLVASLLAKLTVIRNLYRDLYREILDNKHLLSTLEVSYRAEMLVVSGEESRLPSVVTGQASEYGKRFPHLPVMLRISVGRDDSFQDVDLDPYLSFLRSVVVPDNGPEPEQSTPSSGMRTLDRPAEVDAAVSLILDARAKSADKRVFLTGAGGYGKTTLAQMIAENDRIRSIFRGGTLWLTLGPWVGLAHLAVKINDLGEALTGDRHSFTDPVEAGRFLSEHLRQGSPRLLILDDVWLHQQLDPFHGNDCVQLITTRRSDLVPPHAAEIVVGAVTPAQAAALIALGLPAMSDATVAALAELTGRWPLLLALVNSRLHGAARRGGDVEATAIDLLRRLREDGPTALDVDLDGDRSTAVAATIRLSNSMLPDGGAERFLELGIFPDGVAIPIALCRRLWAATSEFDSRPAELLARRLADLSLARLTDARDGQPKLILEAIISQYLRSQLGADELAHTHNLFLESLARELPSVDGTIQWWQLPAADTFLWEHLPRLLIGANRLAESENLVTRFRWVGTKIQIVNVGAVIADLDGLQSRKARRLQRILKLVAGTTSNPAEIRRALWNALAEDPEWRSDVEHAERSERQA